MAPVSASMYTLLEKGSTDSCESGKEISDPDDCLVAALEVGAGVNFQNWVNVITWAGLPCGCFFWFNHDGTVLVDYNTIASGCGVASNTQLICLNEPMPTAAPTIEPSMVPTITPEPTAEEGYALLGMGASGDCPSGKAVPQGECLAAASEVAGHLNWKTSGLNVMTWSGLPCGCFVWHNGDGTVIIDYNTMTTGCGASGNTQMICAS